MLLALSPLGCTAEPPADKPPVVAQVGVPAAEPGAEGKAATNEVVVAEGAVVTNGPAIPAEVPPLSPAMVEVVRLLQAGVTPGVIESFITNSPVPFHVGSAQLVYLTDLGAPEAVMTALIRHDALPAMQALKQGAGSAPPEGVPAVPEAKPAPAVPNAPEPVAVAPPAAEPAPAGPPPPPSSTAVYQVAPETRTVTYSHFYTSLAPYGTWVDVPGYGQCWRPTVAVYEPAWRPYCDGGRWLWSDRGWYWYSTYSWGWAPFHYGRWCQPAGLGWVWVPGTCWGPSWVSWRYTSAGYCGWAPLPPSAGWVSGVGFYNGGVSVGIGFDFGLVSSAYVFCPVVRFCDPRPARYCLPSSQVDTHYKNSTVINNYIVGNNNTVINQGIGFEKVAKVTKESIRKVTVQDVAARGERGPRPERLSEDGRVLAVHRPLWASASDRVVPARTAAVAGSPAPAPSTAPRPLGVTGIRSPSSGSPSSVVRPSASVAPERPAVSVVKPVSSVPVTTYPGSTPPVTVVGSDPKPSSIRRGPSGDNARPGVSSPERQPTVIRPHAVSPSHADGPAHVPAPPPRTVAPTAPRPVTVPAPSSPKPPSRPVVSPKSQGAGPVFAPSTPVAPSAPTLTRSPVTSPAYSPARPAPSGLTPRSSSPSVVNPAPTRVAPAPPAPSRSYVATVPAAPRGSAPAYASPSPGRVGSPGGGGSAPSPFSPRGQGGRSSGGSESPAGGKVGR